MREIYVRGMRGGGNPSINSTGSGLSYPFLGSSWESPEPHATWRVHVLRMREQSPSHWLTANRVNPVSPNKRVMTGSGTRRSGNNSRKGKANQLPADGPVTGK